MAITRLGGATAITGTIPQGNIANASLGAVTALPAAIATGKVLQVVETRLTTVLSTTSSSWTATTGLNASITPSSTSNKVLILLNPTLSSANHGHMGLSRDGGSNFIGSGVSAGSRSGINFYAGEGNSNTARPQSCTILDSPSSTSAVTYQAYWKVSSDTTYLNRTVNDADAAYGSRGVSSITLMEIAG